MMKFYGTMVCPDCVKAREALNAAGVLFDYVDITDINEEGLLYDDSDMKRIAEKFRQEKIDGLFLPHCNFGTEYECARLAKELGVPVLLWGPLDERPDEDAVRAFRHGQGAQAVPGPIYIYDQLPAG